MTQPVYLSQEQPRWRGLGNPYKDKASCGVGLVVDLSGVPSHGVVKDALSLLDHLDHRGARGAEENTGDGAGILLQKPHEFFKRFIPQGMNASDYAVGQVFLPQDAKLRGALIELIETTAGQRHFDVFHWRVLPTQEKGLGRTALHTQPYVMQFFTCPVMPLVMPQFQSELYLLRRVIEQRAQARLGTSLHDFYICSLEIDCIVYKGLLTCQQLPDYFSDLTQAAVVTRFAMVHSRFSTNTLGAWHLAHPCRRVVHNGEFNTLRGNENWMHAREADLCSPLLGDDIELVKPVVMSDASDTAKFDNVLELLLIAGRSLPAALRMMIPEAWENDASMPQVKKNYYDYHSTIMEPWDGPALVLATDGETIAAISDRNGFRPCRYCVTRQKRFVLASEAGVLDIDEADILSKGRLKPGQMLLVNATTGQINDQDIVLSQLAKPHFGQWLKQQRLHLPEFSSAPVMAAATDHAHQHEHLRAYLVLFGYTQEALDYLLIPMAEQGKDPLGSMGNDAPIAAVDQQYRNITDYFQQCFAQVSNPPLDFMREAQVTSLRSYIGKQHNILAAGPEHCRQVLLSSPILSEWQLEALKNIDEHEIRCYEIDMSFALDETLSTAIDRLCRQAEVAIGQGYEILVLSDRKANKQRLPIASLLAVAAVHHGLIRLGLRTRASIVMDVADTYSVHHFCCLIGYGADAVHPWLSYQCLDLLVMRKQLTEKIWDAHQHYQNAIHNGLLKVMSKMGISTLQGYQGAQIFEIIGLNNSLVNEYFPGTAASLSGIDLATLEQRLRQQHELAFRNRVIASQGLPWGGELSWRRDGKQHIWNPFSIAKFQQAARTADSKAYADFVKNVESLDQKGQSIVGLLKFSRRGTKSIDIDEVEPVAKILQRFSTGSMSFGALSKEAHEALAIAMNSIGGISGTGEGGEQVQRFNTPAACTMKQVASGRFGVNINYLGAAQQIEIKMAQGSKPGEGGELPGNKVDLGIAEVRFSTPGVGLISPPPHHDIYSIEDLAQLIFDLKCANPSAEIHVKLVACAGVGTIAAGVVKARADAILISGATGGTGASIITSIKSAGIPWELGLAETQQILLANNLRSRIRLRVDGGLKTGRDVVMAALLGAEEFGFGTAPLVALGCIMLRKCHCNTCSVGIATQDPRLRAKFSGKPQHVVNYLQCVAEEVRVYMAQLGFVCLQDMIGRVDKLAEGNAINGLDLQPLLYRPASGDQAYKTHAQHHAVAQQLEQQFLPKLDKVISSAKSVVFELKITNRDRSFGTLLSHYVTQKRTGSPLPKDCITLLCDGHAGQSFGAFLAPGITLYLTGDANDYVGKGLSGGVIGIRPPQGVHYLPEQTIIVGNVALYGATAGELYINGQAGERFAVRNSGVFCVVEGIGDHGCEYMTGGIVLILGVTGKNFAAGMSGGEAYVLDEEGELADRVNHETVDLQTLVEPRDARLVKALLNNHKLFTGSQKAKKLIDNWDYWRGKFTKVMPVDYQQVLMRAQQKGDDLRTQTPAPIMQQPKWSGGAHAH